MKLLLSVRTCEGGRGGTGGRGGSERHRRSVTSSQQHRQSWSVSPVLWRGSTRHHPGLRSVVWASLSHPVPFSFWFWSRGSFPVSAAFIEPHLSALQVTTTTAGSWSSSAAAVCRRHTSWTTDGCWSTFTLDPRSDSRTEPAVRDFMSPMCSVRRYLKFTLDQYVEMDYILVYFHHGLRSSNKPSVKWLREAYSEFDRKYDSAGALLLY